MGMVPFIAVEGPIGVGKTSLAKAISEHFHYHLVKEIVDENPFLGKFYENIEEWSFQTEMFFLCHRYKQLEEIDRDFLQRQQPVVADYHIMKNLIFAKRTLKIHHYKKYIKIYDILTDGLPQPNMIIYLHASLETLLTRIQQRGRDFEKRMDPVYLQQLSADYEEAFSLFEQANPHIPVLRFNGDLLDFVQREEDLHYIFERVKTVVKGVSQ
ncbi:deoxynucleoside kinase [Parageobacillus thermoglucosidasius]|uniref:Deoxynucleoside kinase n=1 Tax=Parageobacillus thermoglucosidasius TaxID=1426 RepID=A0AB38QYD7_PARTM|nr:deoxynucleoside kinase [Parageobacillus thermoglucosidasius]UOE76349.1 deoxynucleoside kinase [Parageobacillus thermoglucosidasius]GMO01625.1 deoxynucleoside kinase [Parageobacillus thermoglucosidasius]